MKDTKRIKILIALVILLVIISIMQFIIQKYNSRDRLMHKDGYANWGISEDSQEAPSIEDIEANKKIEFENTTILKDLKGALQITTVTEKVEKAFLESIPKVLEETEDMSDDKLSKYYNDNSLEIRYNLYIDNEKSFLNMIEKFENVTSNLTKDYKSCKFSDEDELKLVFSYENGETVECKITGENANLVMFEF